MFYRPKLPVKNLGPRKNTEIVAPELRVQDSEGNSLGVMKLAEALKLAENQGLDLVEIVPNATPPIARIISFDKYRYQKDKADKKERLAQKTAGSKQIQISARAAKNDLQVKVRQLEKFMNEGHQIEIALRLRGREKYNKDWANQKLDEFMKMIPLEYKIVSPPKFGGYGLNVQIGRK